MVKHAFILIYFQAVRSEIVGIADTLPIVLTLCDSSPTMCYTEWYTVDCVLVSTV